MAVAFDAYSRSGASTSPADFNWTHTPVGTPRGVTVYIVQNIGLTDEVIGVTYGGVAMTRVAHNSYNASEDGAVYAYFLGENIPTGAQTVAVDVNATGSSKMGRCYTVTAGNDTEVVSFDDTSISAIAANPSGSLPLSGRTCFVSQGFWAAPNAVGSITPFTDWTDDTNSEIDFGSQVGAAYRYTIIDSADVTFGWTQGSDDALCIAVAVAEISTATTVNCAGTARATPSLASATGKTTVACAGMAKATPATAQSAVPQLVGFASPVRAVSRAFAVAATILACTGIARATPSRATGVSTANIEGTIAASSGKAVATPSRAFGVATTKVASVGTARTVSRAFGQGQIQGTIASAVGTARATPARTVTGAVALVGYASPARATPARAFGVATADISSVVQCAGTARATPGRAIIGGEIIISIPLAVSRATPSRAIGTPVIPQIVPCTGTARATPGRAITAGEIILSMPQAQSRATPARAFGVSTFAPVVVQCQGTARATSRSVGQSRIAFTVAQSVGTARATPARARGVSVTEVASAGTARATSRAIGIGSTKASGAGIARAISRAFGQSKTTVLGSGVARATNRAYAEGSLFDPTTVFCGGTARGGSARAIGSAITSLSPNDKPYVLRVAVGKSTTDSSTITVPMLFDGADYIYVGVFVGNDPPQHVATTSCTIGGFGASTQRITQIPGMNGAGAILFYQIAFVSGIQDVVVTLPAPSNNVAVVAVAVANTQAISHTGDAVATLGDPSLTFATAEDVFVLDFMCFLGSGPSVAAQERELANDTTVDTDNDGVRFGVSTTTGTAPNTTVTWTGNDDDLGWAYIAIGLNARKALSEGIARATNRAFASGVTEVASIGRARASSRAFANAFTKSKVFCVGTARGSARAFGFTTVRGVDVRITSTWIELLNELTDIAAQNRISGIVAQNQHVDIDLEE